MKYFIPILTAPRKEFANLLIFYEVNVQPSININIREGLQRLKRILWKLLKTNNIPGFPSSNFSIGVINLNGHPYPLSNKSFKVQFNRINYNITITKKINRAPTEIDLVNAVSALLSTGFRRFKKKGYLYYEGKMNGGYKVLKNFDMDVYLTREEILVAFSRRISIELPPLSKILKKVKAGELIRRSVRTTLEYGFTKRTGKIKEIVNKRDEKYDGLWSEIKNYYRGEGEEKWNWFSKQKYGVPIVILKNGEKWLSSALTLQTHPSNFDIIEKIYPGFNKIRKLLYLGSAELKSELIEIKEMIKQKFPLFRDAYIKPSRNILEPLSPVNLDQPILRFWKGKSKKPTDIFKLKPIDFNTRNIKTIKIVTSYFFNNYRLKEKLEELFYDLITKFGELGLRVEKDIGAYGIEEAINQANSAEEGVESIILQVLEEKDDRPDSPYAKIRMKAYSKDIPVQTILTNRLDRLSPPIIKNLVTAMYAKIGGIPWNLNDPVSKKFKRAIYVGYDVSNRHGGSSVGTAVVYDSKGQFIFHVPRDLPTKGNSDIIPKEHIAAFIEDVLEESKKYGPIDAVIIHKDGEIRQEELAGIKEGVNKAFNNKTIKVLILGFPKNGPFLFQNGQIAREGTALYIGRQIVDGRSVDTYLLQSISPVKESATPISTLKFRVYYYGTPTNPSALNRDVLIDIIQQVFNLSRLNWSSLRGVSKAPVTVHYAHKASLIRSYGVPANNLDRKKLYML